MRRTLSSLLCLVALSGGVAEAQVTDVTLVPRGQLRLQFDPSFTSWNARFGERLENGALVTENEDLASDLTSETGASVFPGLASLEAHIRSLTGNSGFVGIAGASSAFLSHDVTRIDLGGHLGVFDWLTLGATVPVMKNRTALEVAFRPDSMGGNLGLNPLISDPGGVNDFIASLEAALGLAQARAASICGTTPGTGACSDAASLEGQISGFLSTSRNAYSSSALFPMRGSQAARALTDATTTLDQDLNAAGLGGLGATMAFASEWITSETFASLPSKGGSGIQGAPLAPINALWQIGDVELTALVRIARGELRDSGAVAPRLTYSVGAGFLMRLGTGSVDAHDVFLDLGTGDGQRDFEGRLFGFVGVGERLGLRAGVRYGIQQSLDLLRRVAPPETVTPRVGTLRAVTWTPASYLGFELEPTWRLSPELSLFGSYRLYSKGVDGYEIFGEAAAGSVPVDAADLERESGVTLHQAGFGIRYSSMDGWFAGVHSSPMELHARVLYSAAGSGGQTPIAMRVEMGIKIFRGIWGGDAPAPSESVRSNR